MRNFPVHAAVGSGGVRIPDHHFVNFIDRIFRVA
jgi:hypothetical protein